MRLWLASLSGAVVFGWRSASSAAIRPFLFQPGLQPLKLIPGRARVPLVPPRRLRPSRASAPEGSLCGARLLTLQTSPTNWVPRPSRTLRRAGTTNAGVRTDLRSSPAGHDQHRDSIVPAPANNARTGYPQFPTGEPNMESRVSVVRSWTLRYRRLGCLVTSI